MFFLELDLEYLTLWIRYRLGWVDNQTLDSSIVLAQPHVGLLQDYIQLINVVAVGY